MKSPPLSVFDMLKIGVGPSSSHTMGPWLAARQFLLQFRKPELLQIGGLQVDLYGSLAKTGYGHGTNLAVQWGLLGMSPVTAAGELMRAEIDLIRDSHQINLLGEHVIAFNPKTDIQFHRDIELPEHPNAMRLTATMVDGGQISDTFLSVGGGFVIRLGETIDSALVALPYPIETAADLLGYCQEQNCDISTIVHRNERAWRDDAAIDAGLTAIRDAMYDAVHRGCLAAGELPGGLHVKRRASRMAARLLQHDVPTDAGEFWDAVASQARDFNRVLDWVSCFALAINEENAAFGRVVTAPTNGAAGVIPAVLLYRQLLCSSDPGDWRRFLMTASEIGCLFKKGATISAAQGGCQAEIGVSSAMAAAGLVECMGGSPNQAAVAAEIAMEHHLGLTCDPIGGLVQIPCIERNAMGAIKAITSANIAIQRVDGEARVSLDEVIRTMWQTALDMHKNYKETSEGGLATQISVAVTEC